MDENIVRIINSVAPIRICDIGGWTDTWFSRHGKIFNIAVYPYVEVQCKVVKTKTADKRITINLENFNETYTISEETDIYDKHPLINAAVDVMNIPDEYGFRLNIFSSIPSGASTGTSAAVSIAIIGALDSLTDGRLTHHEVAALAHYVETDKLNLQSGIQDQLCSAYGGINFIDMYEYPRASVSSILLPNSVWWDLENRLALVYIGSPHSSSEVHKKVIEDLGDNAHEDERLEKMRQLAEDAKNALYKGDFTQFGSIMIENTETQRALHPYLICDKFNEIIDICKHYKALGYKVNGAGGDGGSMTILTDGDVAKKREMLKELEEKGFNAIGIYLSRYGLRVWDALQCAV